MTTETRTHSFTTASGIILPLCTVSQIDLIPLEDLFNGGAPQPPLEEADTPEGIKMVPNPGRQEYKDELARFEARRGIFGIATVIELGVDLELTDEQKAQAEKARKKLFRIFPKAENDLENQWDLFTYVKSICPTMDELNLLTSAIVALNTPTAAEVQQHLDSFRPGVSGPAVNVDQDAAVGDNLPFPIDRTQPGKSSDLVKRARTGVLRKA